MMRLNAHAKMSLPPWMVELESIGLDESKVTYLPYDDGKQISETSNLPRQFRLLAKFEIQETLMVCGRRDLPLCM